jgi:hypothetical protein
MIGERRAIIVAISEDDAKRRFVKYFNNEPSIRFVIAKHIAQTKEEVGVLAAEDFERD